MRTTHPTFRAAVGLFATGALIALASCADYSVTNVWDPAVPMTTQIISITPKEVHYRGQPVTVTFRSTPEWPGARTQITTLPGGSLSQDASGAYRYMGSFGWPVETVRVEYTDVPVRAAEAPLRMKQIVARMDFCRGPVDTPPQAYVYTCHIPYDSGGSEFSIWQTARDTIRIFMRDSTIASLESVFTGVVDYSTILSKRPGTTYLVVTMGAFVDSNRITVHPRAP